MSEAIEYVNLVEENNNLKKDIENLTIMINELEQTNSNLISATWRERELKKILTNTLSELEKSKSVIEKQNKKISESINYSKRIQDVILPDENSIKSILPQSFILYIPKDVVSGDYPFFYHEGDTCHIAAVDCTGHGVPGAMLSLIGHLILNDILSKGEMKKVSEILNKMHNKIVKTLKQNIEGNDASDGMDIALCEINLVEKKLKYSGAHRPLYQIRGDELLEFRGSRFPIGGTQYKKNPTYTDYEIDVLPNDLFLIFSDGFQDQFGGPDNEKYGSIRLQNYLLESRHFSLEELKSGLKNEFQTWQKEGKQMDDILFIGFKIP